VPYRLPELLAAVKAGQPTVIPEGEKDVSTLVRLGYVATYNSMSAKKWLRDFDEFHEACGLFVLSTVAARPVPFVKTSL
jgi:hypothetical protein